MPIDGLPRVFKLSDLAERWECSQQQVRKLVESGELRAFRIGKLWRVRVEAVEEFEARPAVPLPEPVPRASVSSDGNLALTRVRLANSVRRLRSCAVEGRGRPARRREQLE